MAVITASQLKAHLQITDTEDDVGIGAAVNAAAAHVRQWCNRSFETDETATAREFYPLHSSVVFTDDFWTDESLVVKIDTNGDGTFNQTITDYALRPVNARVGGVKAPYTSIRPVSHVFPCHVRPSVEVTAKWGWQTVPADVVDAALIQASRLFRRRQSPEGVAGFGQFGEVRVSLRMDPDVEMLLAPYRRNPIQV